MNKSLKNIVPYYHDNDITLYLGDVINILLKLKTKNVNPISIFADPPYFLSGDGYTVSNGKIVSVKKGMWDELKDGDTLYEFNKAWLKACRDIMPRNGSIWISGTFHNIFNIARILEELKFKLLNAVVWNKTNPPPNFTKRFFTHSSEIILWARKEDKTPHYFNYDLMKELNNGKQMQDVWRLPAIAPWEKVHGKHPTQKPLSVLARIILASSQEGELILDPFTGCSTTGIAANIFGRKYIGIDNNKEYLDISIRRVEELKNMDLEQLKNKIIRTNI